MRSDWKIRKSRACKPCWELKYCPYGPLVEQSPLLPSLKADAVEHRDHLARILKTGMIGDTRRLTEKDREQYEEWLGNEGLLLRQALYQLKMEQQITEVSKIENDQEKLDALGGQLPPIDRLTGPRPTVRSRRSYRRELLGLRCGKNFGNVAAALKKKCSDAIATHRQPTDPLPLDPVQEAIFRARSRVKSDSDQHPDHISHRYCRDPVQHIRAYLSCLFCRRSNYGNVRTTRRNGAPPDPFCNNDAHRQTG